MDRLQALEVDRRTLADGEIRPELVRRWWTDHCRKAQESVDTGEAAAFGMAPPRFAWQDLSDDPWILLALAFDSDPSERAAVGSLSDPWLVRRWAQAGFKAAPWGDEHASVRRGARREAWRRICSGIGHGYPLSFDGAATGRVFSTAQPFCGPISRKVASAVFAKNVLLGACVALLAVSFVCQWLMLGLAPADAPETVGGGVVAFYVSAACCLLSSMFLVLALGPSGPDRIAARRLARMAYPETAGRTGWFSGESERIPLPEIASFPDRLYANLDNKRARQILDEETSAAKGRLEDKVIWTGNPVSRPKTHEHQTL